MQRSTLEVEAVVLYRYGVGRSEFAEHHTSPVAAGR